MSLLTAVSLVAVVAAFGVLGRWFTRRTDSLGRRRDLPVWSVSALVLLALLAAVPGAKRRVEERRLEGAASLLVGQSVKVRCQTTVAALVDAGAELGWVAFGPDGVPEHQTLIKREQCGHLEAYRSGGHRAPTFDQVVAVHVLTHEAMHMRGQPVEALAECEAVQRDAVTAQALHATTAEALALARRYWREVYPRMPEDYVTGDCRPGGSLDEHLDSAPWG